MGTKKDELAAVDVLRGLVPDLPRILTASEAPDFLSEDRTLGVEVTEIFTSTNRNRARALAQRRLVREAKQRWLEREGASSIAVHVAFQDQQPERRAELENIVNVLLAVVEQADVAPGGHVERTWKEMYGQPAHRFFKSISVRNMSPASGVWGAPSVGVVREDCVEDLQAVIDRKGRRISAYLKRCSSVWLVIVVTNEFACSFLELGPETRTHPYVSPFERVFVVLQGEAEAVELELAN